MRIIVLIFSMLLLTSCSLGLSHDSSANNRVSFTHLRYYITQNSTRDLVVKYSGSSSIIVTFTSSNNTIAYPETNTCSLSGKLGFKNACTIKVAGVALGNTNINIQINDVTVASTLVQVVNYSIPGKLAFIPQINTVTLGSYSTFNLTLVDSSGINILPVSIVNSKANIASLNFSHCNLSTTNPSCILVVEGNSLGSTSISANANNYSPLTDNINVVGGIIPGFLKFVDNNNIVDINQKIIKTLALIGSSGVNLLPIMFSTSSELQVISPQNCVLSSTNTTCSVVLEGNGVGLGAVMAEANGYLNAGDIVNVVTAPGPTPGPTINPGKSGNYSLTLENSNTTYLLYRTNDNSLGEPIDYQGDPPYNLTKFSGWVAQISPWNGTEPAPDPMLTVTNVSGDHGCTFFTESSNYLEGVFSVANNNHNIVLNPNIPESFFNNPSNSPITCTGEVNLVWNLNGQFFRSNTEKISATIYPNYTQISNNRYVKIISTGATTLVTSSSYYLPIFLNGQYAPLNNYGRPIYSDFNGGIGQNGAGTEYDLFAILANSNNNFTVSGGNSEPDSNGCIYYPTFTYNGQTGTKLNNIVIPDSANTAANAITINATWQQYCFTQNPSTNSIITTSGAMQSKKRFQYGTFQVVMKPSNVSGVNSSFYTFFGDGTITSSNNNDYNWGYTWHEIDFEFVPGLHPIGQYPVNLPFGFSTPYTSPEVIGSSVSLNVFSPGSAMNGEFGANQHHRFCPNASDPECLITNFNPYDGNFHTFTMTWTPGEIKYYFDGELANILKIIDRTLGTPLEQGNYNDNLLWQSLFNNGGIIDANNNLHPTSPQFISMNFWIPTVQGDFGGIFDNSVLSASKKILAKYQSIKWSACVDAGNFEDSCNNDKMYGKVYSSTGIPLAAKEQNAYIWNFTNMSESELLQDWMYAPLMGFDENNSIFVQNGVTLDNTDGLSMCMMSQWNNMATTGKKSVGCDGNMILPPPGEISPTNFDQALLVVNVDYNLASYTGVIGNVYPGAVPQFPISYGSIPGFLNGGWVPSAANGCISGSISGLSCLGNGWFADPRMESMLDSGRYQSTFLYWVTPSLLPLKWYLNQSQIFSINGYNCSVIYTPTSITNLLPQKTYQINAAVTCK